MITAMSVFTKIRLFAGDMNKTKFSDYEVMSAMNDALLYLAKESKLFKPYFTENYNFSSLKDKYEQLPEKTLEVLRVFDDAGRESLRVFSSEPTEGEYRIKDTEIKTGESGEHMAVLVSLPSTITDLTDIIPLPAMYVVPIAKVAVSLLSGKDQDAVLFSQYFNGSYSDSNSKKDKKE